MTALERLYRRKDHGAVSKTCRTCGEAKDIGEFWFQDRRTGLRQSECKTCMRARTAEWFRNNKTAAEITTAVNLSRKNFPLKQVLRGAKARAKKKRLPFDLTLEDLLPVPERCPVLGIPLEWTIATGRGVSPGTPSLERLVLERGYVRGNVMLISYRANVLRKDATLEELKMMVAFYEKHSSGDLGGSRNSGSQHVDRAVLCEVPEVQRSQETSQPE